MRTIIIGCMFLNIVIFFVGGDDTNNKQLIAKVNGQDIYYPEIMIDEDKLNKAFERRYGRFPRESDKEELADLKISIETNRLQEAIRQKIRDAEYLRLGIAPTDDEIEARCISFYSPQRRKELAKQLASSVSILLQAYEAVLYENKSPDQVYEELLSDMMSREEWRMRLQYDVTEESINRLRRIRGRSIEDLTDCKVPEQRESFRMLIIMEREDAALDAEIARTDPEYAEYLHLAEVNPSDPKVQEKGPRYRDARRYLWWEERMRSADVTILDPAYRDAWPVDKRND